MDKSPDSIGSVPTYLGNSVARASYISYRYQAMGTRASIVALYLPYYKAYTKATYNLPKMHSAGIF